MSVLPRGTVTYLFTDIEGSTSLWERDPKAMKAALARHHAILRQAIESNNGTVFQIVGDSFQSAFDLATDALIAAIGAQQGLAQEPWGETGPLRVRMGLNTGLGEPLEHEYTSNPTLNRVARVMSAASGDQILLSQETADLVYRDLPPGVSLKDLGEHRLKGLSYPEHLFQVVASNLRQNFPPLPSHIQHPNYLPSQLTSFVGREAETAAVKEILLQPEVRLLTIFGSGGFGKTRLALKIAEDLIDEYPDGAWFVDLSPLTDPQLVPQALAGVLGLKEQPWRPLTELITENLHTKKLLIILDNCEHLAQASANLCQALLQKCKFARILATSREPLGVPGETLYPLPALSLPGPRSQPLHEIVDQSEAVRLFAERAASAQPNFTLTSANAPAVAMICQRLDGIPLAIELAAARMRAFSVEQIAERIEDRFRLLSAGSRTSLPRQHTLRALIDWSYNLLTEQERLLFLRLSVFQGGWTLEAAEATCSGAGLDPYDIFDLLARLVDRSLVVVDEQETGRRHRLLETIRQYAAEALNEIGQQATWRDRHLNTYLAFADEAEPKLRSAEDIIWMDLVARDHDNLRQAIDWAIQTGNSQAALGLCADLYYFWFRRGHIQEGMRQHQRAADLQDASQHPLELAKALKFLGFFYWINGAYPTALVTLNRSIDLHKNVTEEGRHSYALALFYLGMTHMRLGNFSAAQKAGQEALEIFQDVREYDGMAFGKFLLGRIQLEQGQMQLAEGALKQALEWSRKAGDRLVISLVISSLEILAISEGDYAGAQALNEEELELARQMKDIWMISSALREAGNIAQAKGDFGRAQALFLESGELYRQQGLPNDLARTCFKLGYLAILQGDMPAGKVYIEEALDLYRKLKHERGLTEILDGWAAHAAATGRPELAARLQGAADASFQLLGLTRWPQDLIEYQKKRTALLETLGEQRYQEAYSLGKTLDLEQALGQTVY